MFIPFDFKKPLLIKASTIKNNEKQYVCIIKSS